MSSNNLNPNNNVAKKEDILELWYLATGEKLGKVNLATNQEVANAVLANKSDYMKLVKDKTIPLVYENPIYLKDKQNLHIVNYANTHYFDLSNPQLGVESRANLVGFKKDLEDKGKKDKTVVFFAGNLIGKEWKIGDLNNASIDENKKILFWGLQSRVNQLINDIKFAARNGADQIFLMNGREEHIAKQKLNVDVLSTVLRERFNDLLFEYVIKLLRNDQTIKEKKVEVAYVRGVKKIFNIVKVNKDKTTSNYTFSMHTNLKTTSDVLSSNKKAAEKQHAGFAQADAIFIQGENASGVINDDANIAILTGQSTYNNVAKGNLPGFAPKGRSSLTLLLGEKSHDVEIAWTMDLINNETYPLEKKLAELRAREEVLVELCEKKLAEAHNNFAKNQCERDFNGIVKEMKKLGD